ncbi:MAG: methyltransferase domain-containing protein [Thermoplasmata archaeon]|nr:methyltransferase domain-containing protein [Thermoplasmata archaeon]
MSSFDERYAGTPPWDVGHPQTEYISLQENGEIKGSVLDIGCGTGENALLMAEKGDPVCGIDSSPRAIKKAQAKAKERGVEIDFRVWDAFDLEKLDRQFDTVIDSGLFHAFEEEDHPALVKSIRSALKTSGTYFILCFSVKETREKGPRRITEEEIQSDFNEGWNINYIKDARFDSLIHEGGARAWLSSITKV